MPDISQFFISSAWAQTVADPGQSSVANSYMPESMVFFAIMAVFYLLVFRPQQKKIDEQEKMIKALKRGDRIVTTGGTHGKIVKLEGDDALIIEIADGVQIKQARSHIYGLSAKTEPVASADETEKKS